MKINKILGRLLFKINHIHISGQKEHATGSPDEEKSQKCPRICFAPNGVKINACALEITHNLELNSINE